MSEVGLEWHGKKKFDFGRPLSESANRWRSEDQWQTHYRQTFQKNPQVEEDLRSNRGAGVKSSRDHFEAQKRIGVRPKTSHSDHRTHYEGKPLIRKASCYQDHFSHQFAIEHPDGRPITPGRPPVPEAPQFNTTSKMYGSGIKNLEQKLNSTTANLYKIQHKDVEALRKDIAGMNMHTAAEYINPQVQTKMAQFSTAHNNRTKWNRNASNVGEVVWGLEYDSKGVPKNVSRAASAARGEGGEEFTFRPSDPGRRPQPYDIPSAYHFLTTKGANDSVAVGQALADNLYERTDIQGLGFRPLGKAKDDTTVSADSPAWFQIPGVQVTPLSQTQLGTLVQWKAPLPKQHTDPNQLKEFFGVPMEGGVRRMKSQDDPAYFLDDPAYADADINKLKELRPKPTGGEVNMRDRWGGTGVGWETTRPPRPPQPPPHPDKVRGGRDEGEANFVYANGINQPGVYQAERNEYGDEMEDVDENGFVREENFEENEDDFSRVENPAMQRPSSRGGRSSYGLTDPHNPYARAQQSYVPSGVHAPPEDNPRLAPYVNNQQQQRPATSHSIARSHASSGAQSAVRSHYSVARSAAGSVLSAANLAEHDRVLNSRGRNSPREPLTHEAYLADKRFYAPSDAVRPFSRGGAGNHRRTQSAKSFPAGKSDISRVSSKRTASIVGQNHGIITPPSDYRALVKDLDKPLSPPLSATDLAMALKRAASKDDNEIGFNWETKSNRSQSIYSIHSSAARDSVASEIRPGYSMMAMRSATGNYLGASRSYRV